MAVEAEHFIHNFLFFYLVTDRSWAAVRQNRIWYRSRSVSLNSNHIKKNCTHWHSSIHVEHLQRQWLWVSLGGYKCILAVVTAIQVKNHFPLSCQSIEWRAPQIMQTRLLIMDNKDKIFLTMVPTVPLLKSGSSLLVQISWMQNTGSYSSLVKMHRQWWQYGKIVLSS